MNNRIVLILVAISMTVLAGLFAGAETGIYRLSRLRLRLGIQKRRWSSLILGKVMHDSSGLVLSTLIGTNLAHYFATSTVTYIFLDILQSGHGVELFTTLLTAPVLFVFSELIPKNLFLYRSDLLTPIFAPLLFAFHKLFSLCGAVPLLKLVSNAVGRLTGAQTQSKAAMVSSHRHQLRAILEDTHEEGLLSTMQADMMNRIVNIPGLHIRLVMVPISKVQMVNVNSNRDALLAKLRNYSFTRLLVTENGPENVTGFVNIYEALSLSEQFENLRNLIKPIRKLAADTTVIEAINIMQRENHKIALVTRTSLTGRGKPIGIVTMKDLVEELLGELTEW